MARFYGSMKGSRGQTTRMGSPASGMTAHIRGWHVGVRVEIVDNEGKDQIIVYRTGGSNEPETGEILAEVQE